jgi:serine/threonine protein kinase
MRRGVLPVAVKVVAGAVAKSEDAQLEFLREVAYLRSLLCPNIVQFQVQ